MDYSVIAPKPLKKSGTEVAPPPPPEPAPVPPPAETVNPSASPPAKAPAQVAPPNQGCVQPRCHHHEPYNMGVPMAYIDQVSQVKRVKNVELTHSRTFRMNFRNDPYDCFHHQGHGPPPPPPPPPPCRYKPPVPPPRSCMHGPSPPPPGPPPASRAPPEPSQCSVEPSYGPPPPGYYPPPNYGGYFSDENPNGCILM